MTLLALILLLTTNPTGDVLRERVSCIERNEVWHGCEDELRFSFAQLLFRDFCFHRGTHEIEAWRMTRSSGDVVDKIEIRFKQTTGLWEAAWRDGGSLRVVEAGTCYETAADTDIEVAERARLPVQFRRELRQPVGKGK